MIPVDRDAGASALRTMMTLARSLSANGRPIIIFPEGTRVRHGERPPLQSGFAGLYKVLRLPVVPIAVNSGRLTPKGKPWWHSGVMTYKVGETIPAGLPREEVEARVHAAINALNL
jgi:1-acyl-sn-glycerol-3-phosphate acyltransferase